MPTRERLHDSGLVPGPRGWIANAASPWLWRPVNCERLLVVSCLVTGALIARSWYLNKSLIGLLFNASFGGLVFFVPSHRSLTRQRRSVEQRSREPERQDTPPPDEPQRWMRLRPPHAHSDSVGSGLSCGVQPVWEAGEKRRRQRSCDVQPG